MRSSIALNTPIWLLCSVSAFVSATAPLATHTPCPSCPKSVMPPPMTITEQFQAVSTCVPEKVYSKNKNSYKIEPSCSSYNWVSTEIPCSGGSTSTLVTQTDQIIELSYVSTVLTSLYNVPCPTTAPSWNGTTPKYSKENCTSTALTTMIVDISCPYNEMGPLAIPPYEGGGLCTTCSPDANGAKSQGVNVSKCLNGVCSTYSETWVSRKPAPATSTSAAQFSSSAYCSGGMNTIPVTTTWTPSGPAYTNPVTSTFQITTSVPSPQVVDITTVITVTFTGEPVPAIPSSTYAAPVSASTYCSENGMHTIPITTTFTPTNPAYTPITTTVFYTTSVSDAPRNVVCTTTVTVIFTTTYCPETVVSGSTVPPTSQSSSASTSSGASTSTSGPATVSATSTSSQTSSSPSGPTSSGPSSLSTSSVPSSSGPTSSGGSPTTTSTGGPSTTPTSPPVVGECDFFGCLGSTDDFATFSLIETSGEMTIELCTSECLASGMPYSGLYSTECYCASSIDAQTGVEKANGVCDLPCPGNSLEACGGNCPTGPRLRNRNQQRSMLLDVYECSVPTTTSSSTSTTSCTTSCGPDVSSDPDSEPEKKGIHADMETSQRKGRFAPKLRRGGMLRNPNKAVKGPALAKRDYGLKRNGLM